ncbi:siderophore-interacting protein [Oryzobacter sp. R7]|uniref:siderophore-interacting protein n=1 Tax=Oryzobacter faecalis TaxID=3388656 RepID=UPI00398C9326
MKVVEKVHVKVARLQSRLTTASPVPRADQPQFAMTVAAVTDLGGGMRRVTFEAPELAVFETCGPDEYFGLLMPARGRPLALPDPGMLNVRAAVADLPEEDRPDLRWYTIRAHDPAAARIEVDIVTHGDCGPGSAWAGRARPGDRAGFRASGALYRGGDLAGRQVLVADETAVPSVAAILESLGGPGAAAARGVEVHVEVGDPAVLAAYDLGAAHVHVRRGIPGSAVVPALDRHLARGGESVAYAWACGESDLAAGARRTLVRHGVDRRRIYFCGYWKLGQARG